MNETVRYNLRYEGYPHSYRRSEADLANLAQDADTYVSIWDKIGRKAIKKEKLKVYTFKARRGADHLDIIYRYKSVNPG